MKGIINIPPEAKGIIIVAKGGDGAGVNEQGKSGFVCYEAFLTNEDNNLSSGPKPTLDSFAGRFK